MEQTTSHAHTDSPPSIARSRLVSSPSSPIDTLLHVGLVGVRVPLLTHELGRVHTGPSAGHHSSTPVIPTWSDRTLSSQNLLSLLLAQNICKHLVNRLLPDYIYIIIGHYLIWRWITHTPHRGDHREGAWLLIVLLLPGRRVIWVGAVTNNMQKKTLWSNSIRHLLGFDNG